MAHISGSEAHLRPAEVRFVSMVRGVRPRKKSFWTWLALVAAIGVNEVRGLAVVTALGPVLTRTWAG